VGMEVTASGSILAEEGENQGELAEAPAGQTPFLFDDGKKERSRSRIPLARTVPLPLALNGGPPFSCCARAFRVAAQARCTVVGPTGSRLFSALSVAESVPSEMPLWRARRIADLRARPRAPLPPVVEPGAPHVKFKSAFKRWVLLREDQAGS